VPVVLSWHVSGQVVELYSVTTANRRGIRTRRVTLRGLSDWRMHALHSAAVKIPVHTVRFASYCRNNFFVLFIVFVGLSVYVHVRVHETDE